MAHANYTVSSHASIESSGDNVNSGTIPATTTLIITPDSGYVATASDFSIGDPLPPEVLSVTFSNSATAGQPGNLVYALVTFNHFVMPSADKEILIDIDGSVDERTNPQKDIAICIDDNIPTTPYEEYYAATGASAGTPSGGIMPSTLWPATITVSGTPVTPGNNFPGNTGKGYFLTTTQGTGITTTSSTNSSWSNPINSLPGIAAGIHNDAATVTTHQGSLTPNVTHTLFEKIFWTPPEEGFEIIPFYTLSAAASASGYYTIDETPDVFTLNKTLTQTSTNSHVVYCDTTDILPGMQVTGANLTSCAGPPGGYDPATGTINAAFCYPWFFADIRVAGVDTTNNRVYLTEQNTFTSGDILTFHSTMVTTDGTWTAVPDVLCKKFTVKFNSNVEVPCSVNHEIDFAAHTRSIQLQTEGDPSPLITTVNIDTDNISKNGETRTLTVRASNTLVRFDIVIYDEAGVSYDFGQEYTDSDGNTRTNEPGFTGQGNTLLTMQQVDSATLTWTTPIVFPPAGTTDKQYSVRVTPTNIATNDFVSVTATFATGVTGTPSTITSYADKTVTLTSDAGSSGITIASGLTDEDVISAQGEDDTDIKNVSISGAITKGGNVIYTNRSTIGEFTNASANSMTSALTATFTGSGTTSITATVSGTVSKTPTANTTVTVPYGNYISQTPNCYDSEFTLSVEQLQSAGGGRLRVHRTLPVNDISEGGIASISSDYDATFQAGTTITGAHKDFEVVSASGLSHGTLGSNGTDYNDNYFFGNSSGTQGSSTEVDQINYKLTSAVDSITPGVTQETFTYRCNDGTTNSATKTATINFIP